MHTCAIDLCGNGVCGPTVSASKSVDDTTPEVTRSATYTVTLNNTNDTGAATNLSFTDNVPSGYVITNVSAPGATSTSNTTGSFTVGYDSLPVHQLALIQVGVTVPKPAGVAATNCGNLTFQDLLGAAQSPLTTNPCATTTPCSSRHTSRTKATRPRTSTTLQRWRRVSPTTTRTGSPARR